MYRHMPVARTVRIMHRARECKVHAEQTSRPDASEWTELRASLPPSPPPLPHIPAWCTRAYVHMCAPGGTQRYSRRRYKVLSARVNVPRGRVSLLSFIPYFPRRPPPPHPRAFFVSLIPYFSLEISLSFYFPFFPLTVHYSSHSYTVRAQEHTPFSLSLLHKRNSVPRARIERDQTLRGLLPRMQNGIFARHIAGKGEGGGKGEMERVVGI